MQCDVRSTICDGGYLDSAMNLGLIKGISYEEEFPYNVNSTYLSICQASNQIAFIENSTRITKLKGLTNDQIKELLLQRPLNIAITSKGWQNYAPGIQYTFKCSKKNSVKSSMDHTVLLVGWTET